MVCLFRPLPPHPWRATLCPPGLGTKDHVLIDLVHTHTNAQIAAIKKKWEAKVSPVDPIHRPIRLYAREQQRTHARMYRASRSGKLLARFSCFPPPLSDAPWVVTVQLQRHTIEERDLCIIPKVGNLNDDAGLYIHEGFSVGRDGKTQEWMDAMRGESAADPAEFNPGPAGPESEVIRLSSFELASTVCHAQRKCLRRR